MAENRKSAHINVTLTYLCTTTANSSMPVSELAHVDWSIRAGQSMLAPCGAGFVIVTTPEELRPAEIGTSEPINM